MRSVTATGVVPDVPLTPVGKVDKKLLLTLITKGEDTG
jgi:non-ribosomal peptide synthetase component E (peptide arylation enzyme)